MSHADWKDWLARSYDFRPMLEHWLATGPQGAD